MAYKEQFILANSRSTLDRHLDNGNINAETIAFVNELGNECIHTQNTDFQFVPSKGKEGQVLISTNGKGKWGEINMLDLISYGVSWNTNISDPTLTRVGNQHYHKTLPIQNGMKGCVYDSVEHKVVYWLDDDDWTYKRGGNPSKGQVEDLAKTDGTDGDVMVYVPEFYIRSWIDGDKREVRISPIKVDDSWEHQPAVYVSAYRCTILNSNAPSSYTYLNKLSVNSAVSVANLDPSCRGATNTASNDTNPDINRKDLGKCRTRLSRSNMREAAHTGNKALLSYKEYKNIFYWLWVIEYATFNCQLDYTEELTPEGFKKGGLSTGSVKMEHWNEYNYCKPIVNNGYTNSIGNRTGVKRVTIPSFETSEGVSYPNQWINSVRWRGIEDPFGLIWHNVDGILVKDPIIEDGITYYKVYTTTNPSLYNDSDSTGMKYTGKINRVGGSYIKEWDLGTTAEIIPISYQGDSTLYKCDYCFVNMPVTNSSFWMGGFGCGAVAGSGGLASIYSGFGVDGLAFSVGFRAVCPA